MEEKKSKSITLVVILSLVILGLIGYIVYDNFLSKEAKKINDNVIEKTSSEEETKIIENNYQIYSENFRKEFTKFDSNNNIFLRVKSEYIPEGYTMFLNDKGSLYVVYSNNELNRKYGEFKIADNVLSFYSISTGNDYFNTLYFINDNGTVGSAEIEHGAIDNNGTIVIDNDLGYKNIVTVMSGIFGDDFTGWTGPIFVDINGKIFSDSLKK